jgi:hypothetical protein
MRFFLGPRVKLHLLCASNRVPLTYELTTNARENVADLSPTAEFLADVRFLREEEVTCRLFGDLAYQSGQVEEELAESGILLVSERAKQQRGAREQIEIAFASLKWVFGLGETLAKTLVGRAVRILRPRSLSTLTPSWSIG